MGDQSSGNRQGFYKTGVNAAGRPTLFLYGDWRLMHAALIEQALAGLNGRGFDWIDLSGIEKLDTSGALLVRWAAKLCEDRTKRMGESQLTGIKAQHQGLMDKVDCCPPKAVIAPDRGSWYTEFLADVGEESLALGQAATRLIGFIGLVVFRLFRLLRYPKDLRVTALVYQLDQVGLRSLGIVGLISFLIGAVMINQGAVQLAKFGADIFVIDMLGIGHLREMGILLTAIIIAGRSGSAFTAQIGAMRLHEEVDAMTTIGMNPIDVLVLPRVLALVMALPLLAFFSDIVGISGGILMAWAQLGISPGNFLVYFRDVVAVDHLLVGLIKAPFFALVIAVSGCFEGLKVERSADALGMHTTRSVVQSIFLVIVLDALFAIFFTNIGL